MRLKFLLAYMAITFMSLWIITSTRGQTIPPPVYLPVIGQNVEGLVTVAPTVTPTATITSTPVDTGTVAILSYSVFPTVDQNAFIVGELINQRRSNVASVIVDVALLNSVGALIDEDSGKAMLPIIPAGAKAPFRVILRNPPNISALELTVSWVDTSVPAHSLEIIQTATSFDDLGAYHVQGNVRNQTGEARNAVRLVAAMYDGAGKVIGADYINPIALSPGQELPFDVRVFFWNGKPTQSQVAGFAIVAVGN